MKQHTTKHGLDCPVHHCGLCNVVGSCHFEHLVQYLIVRMMCQCYLCTIRISSVKYVRGLILIFNIHGSVHHSMIQ